MVLMDLCAFCLISSGEMGNTDGCGSRQAIRGLAMYCTPWYDSAVLPYSPKEIALQRRRRCDVSGLRTMSTRTE